MRWGFRHVARCAAAVSLAIAVTACGGGGDDAAEQTDASASEEAAAAAVEASAEALVVRWGEEGAFYVAFRANDLGYRTQQVVDAADTIAADGTIPGVAREGEPLGMLAELPDGEPQSLRRTAAPVVDAASADVAGDDIPEDAYIGSVDATLADVYTAAREAADQAEARDTADEGFEMIVIIAVQKLGMQGYSGPQIIEAILLFDATINWAASIVDSNCHIAIRSGDKWLEPDFPPAEKLGCTPAWIDDPEGRFIEDPDVEVAPTSEISGTDQAGSVEPDGDPEAGYRFTAVLDLSDETGYLLYQWHGTFDVNDDGTITGAGVASGASAGTCESPGYEGTVEGPYDFSAEGTFDIVGQSSADELEIRLANPAAQFTAEQGDRSILCVDISADIALDIARLPLGGPELELGSIAVPTTGGSATIDAGDGIVFVIEVTPS